MPGATITATNVGTGVSRSAVTDSNGRFVFTNLQPGTYEIAAELAGFAKNSGKLVVPVGAQSSGQSLLVLEKQPDGTVSRRNVLAVRFVPLLDQRGNPQ